MQASIRRLTADKVAGMADSFLQNSTDSIRLPDPVGRRSQIQNQISVIAPSGFHATDQIPLVRRATGGTVLANNSLVNQIADFVLKFVFPYHILYIDKILRLPPFRWCGIDSQHLTGILLNTLQIQREF